MGTGHLQRQRDPLVEQQPGAPAGEPGGTPGAKPHLRPEVSSPKNLCVSEAAGGADFSLKAQSPEA